MLRYYYASICKRPGTSSYLTNFTSLLPKANTATNLKSKKRCCGEGCHVRYRWRGLWTRSLTFSRWNVVIYHRRVPVHVLIVNQMSDDGNDSTGTSDDSFNVEICHFFPTVRWKRRRIRHVDVQKVRDTTNHVNIFTEDNISAGWSGRTVASLPHLQRPPT